MPSREPGGDPDPAARLLGRWEAHHAGAPRAAEGAPAEAPDAPEDQADDQSSAAPPGGRAPTSPKHVAPRGTPGRRRPPTARGSGQTRAGREVLDALRGTTARAAADPRVDPAPAPTPPTAPPAAAEVDPPAPRRPPVPAVALAGSADVEFAPRTGLRRVLAALVLLALLATGAAGYVASTEPTTLTVGVAVTLGVVTLLLYGVRASSAPPTLAIRSGQLEVVRGGTREVFDLTSRFTRMEVVGTPGRRGWKVLMARFGRDPLVIDASMVDPAQFTAAIERHRPRQRS